MPTTVHSGSQRHALSSRYHAIGALLLSATLLGAGYFAHLHSRPLTAALLAILSVTTFGALLGVRAGLFGGIAASLAYNLLFTDPYLRFNVASADDLVPILALNVCAIASGLIAGKLRDRAVIAETSNRQIAELLKFSQDLQRALSLDEIERIVGSFLRAKAPNVRARLRVTSAPSSAVEQLKETTEDYVSAQFATTRFLLESTDLPVGELLVEYCPGEFEAKDMRPLLPIVAMATQRCLLATAAGEADLIRQSEKFKTALLSSVSHDLRTPLAAISASASSLSALGSKLDTDTREDLLRSIEQQCDRLDRLTTNLLNLGRIECGLDFEKMPLVDAVEVLGSTLARARSAQSTHSFERSFKSGSAIVRADEALLEQLFFNVLINAVTHTPPGTKVHVRATCSERNANISVEDNGPGIPSEDWERVFDRFFRGQRGERVGSGLGLSIARGFADAVGGAIHVGRPIDFPRGTRVDISLPLAIRE